MINYRFTYKPAKNKKPKNDILIEAKEREEAIITFESTYPNLKWYQTTVEK